MEMRRRKREDEKAATVEKLKEMKVEIGSFIVLFVSRRPDASSVEASHFMLYARPVSFSRHDRRVSRHSSKISN